MINLLPPELKQNYGYARRNSALLRIVSAFGFGIIGLVAIAAAGMVYLQQTANTFTAQAEKAEIELKEQKQAEVVKEVTAISSDLKLAVQVLSNEVLFSKLLNQLAVITPNKARLSGIKIAQFGGGMDISAETMDYNSATQLQLNMADPANRIFAKADIVSINCESGGTAAYPCRAVYRTLFSTDNPFLFINGKAGN